VGDDDLGAADERGGSDVGVVGVVELVAEGGLEGGVVGFFDDVPFEGVKAGAGLPFAVGGDVIEVVAAAAFGAAADLDGASMLRRAAIAR
jgi:hypothetical protein